MEDSKIINLYWARDEAAIAQTDATYGRKLHALSNRILNNREDAQECVNDTYMSTWKAIPPQRPDHFYAFLASICRNLSLHKVNWKLAAKRNAEIVALTDEMEQCIPDNRRDWELEDREIGRVMDARREAVMKSVYSAFAIPADENLTEKVEAWNAQIKALLVQNGFPADYLEPVFHCAQCEDTGYTGSGKKTLCACARAMYTQLLEKEGGFEREQTFENYDPNVFPDTPMDDLPDSQAAFRTVSQRRYMEVLRRKCEGYADALPNPPQRTLLLYGGSGLGKTYLLRCIHARAREKGVPALCVTANQFIRTARQAIFQRSQEDLDALYETELLLLDDLGTEPLIENVTVEELFNLINERQNARKCTVLSTNLTLNEIKTRYTERILSRLRDAHACQTLQFLGRDIRQLPNR